MSDEKRELRKLPSALERATNALTYKEIKKLKSDGVNLREMKGGEEEDEAIIALLKLRNINPDDHEDLEYGVMYAFLMRIMQATYNPHENEAVKD